LSSFVFFIGSNKDIERWWMFLMLFLFMLYKISSLVISFIGCFFKFSSSFIFIFLLQMILKSQMKMLDYLNLRLLNRVKLGIITEFFEIYDIFLWVELWILVLCFRLLKHCLLRVLLQLSCSHELILEILQRPILHPT